MTAIALLAAGVPAAAEENCYDHYYSIHGAIHYAYEWVDGHNSDYANYDDDGNDKTDDCTNFVSQCITEGGGLEEDALLNRNNNPFYRFIRIGFDNEYRWTFSHTGTLHHYLTDRKGYSQDVIRYGETMNFTVNTGDVVLYDFENDGELDHAAIVVKKADDGTPLVVCHSHAYKDVSYDFFINRNTVAYIVHMTDAAGLTDVTDQFIGDRICMYSKKTGSIIRISGRQVFTVMENDYGEAGFLSDDGRYLSVDIGQDDVSAPACIAGKDQRFWESFRIFTDGQSYYLQSMANGKWLQMDACNTFRASAASASTWEQLEIYR
ncbi:MAG: amidase domain-containing protein, partial [Solobacterium sp.]|nr:amidase domain-containing protein [Solobacterium sp.]